MERIKVLVCLLHFFCVLSVVCGRRAVVAVWDGVGEAFSHHSMNRSVVVIKVVHFLTVRCRHVLWGWCGAAVLIGRCVSDGSFCVAAANIGAVQGI